MPPGAAGGIKGCANRVTRQEFVHNGLFREKHGVSGNVVGSGPFRVSGCDCSFTRNDRG